MTRHDCFGVIWAQPERSMVLKPILQIFEPDPRYGDMCVVEAGIARRLTIEDHHAAIAKIVLSHEAPQDVLATFDRARNILLYAWFDYELFVVAETQALTAFEMALRHRLDASRGRPLSDLIKEARRLGIFPSTTTSTAAQVDPVDVLRHLRNDFAHGTKDVHSPAMALDVVRACANAIGLVFPADARGQIHLSSSIY